MRRFWIIVLFTSWVSAATAGATAPPVRIMPLGDSLTSGNALTSVQGGYRNRLHTLLTTFGYTVDFVGTQGDTANPTLPDVNHEGHGGYLISNIQANIGGWLDTVADPDVVLLLIGTNDIWQNIAVSTAQTGLTNLIVDIATMRPFAKIIVSTLPARIDSSVYEALQVSYNSGIPGIVAQQVALGRQVSWLDMHSVLTPFDYSSDGVHPSTTGYEKMADTWRNGITGVISPEGTNNPPAIARIEPQVDLTNLSVTFSKPVADKSVDLANFSVSNGVTISNAVLDVASKRTITFTTSQRNRGMVYRLAVGGVHDRTAQRATISPGSFAYFHINAVNNGSFEDGFTEWTVTGTASIELAAPPRYTATHGVKLVSFNGNNTATSGMVSQTFTTTAGVAYTLAFDMGVIGSAATGSEQRLQVTIGGGTIEVLSEIATQAKGAGDFAQWTNRYYTFVSSKNTAIVTFRDVSRVTKGIDTLLDNVSISGSSGSFNNPPLAFAAASAVNEDEMMEIHLSGSDLDGEPLAFAVAANPNHGRVTMNGARANYIPSRDYFGVDSLTFTVSDGVYISPAAKVTITVHPREEFTQWMESFNLAAPADVDSDGDCIPNSVEYLVGGNPANRCDAALLPTVSLVTADPDNDSSEADYLLFIYRRTDLANGDPSAAFASQCSAVLDGLWRSAEEAPGVIIRELDDAAGVGVDLVESYFPLNPGPKLFVRLGVNLDLP